MYSQGPSAHAKIFQCNGRKYKQFCGVREFSLRKSFYIVSSQLLTAIQMLQPRLSGTLALLLINRALIAVSMSPSAMLWIIQTSIVG